MEITTFYRTKEYIRNKLPPKTEVGRMSVSTDAVNTLKEAIDRYVQEVVEEAVQANYTVIKPTDIRRGMNKFNAKEMKRALDVVNWSIDGLVQLKTRIEDYNIE